MEMLTKMVPGTRWILREGENYAWNYPDCSAGLVSGRCSADVESQSFLGLLPERWLGSHPRRRGRFTVAWPNLDEIYRRPPTTSSSATDSEAVCSQTNLDRVVAQLRH